MTMHLFSFGTLQLPHVQRSLLGTTLDGEPDALVGYRVSEVRITDPAVIEASGSDVHPGIVATGDPADRVDGVVFEVTPEQLAVIDRYEEVAYRRIEVPLASGRTAFCYEPRA